MKSLWTYIIVSTISMLLLFQIAIILAVLMPEIYEPIADLSGRDELANKADSLNTTTGKGENGELLIDSLFTDPVWKDTVAVRNQNIADLHASIRNLEIELQREKQRYNTLETKLEGVNTQLEERASKEMETLVKMLESMPPEDAVKILRTTSDKEVRQALLLVNRRQASRIMALLEPDRAARIMKFTVEGAD